MTTHKLTLSAVACAAGSLLALDLKAQEGTAVEAKPAAQSQSPKVKAADVTKRLRMRTPQFRKAKLFDAKDLPKIEAPAKPVAGEGAAGPMQKARLFGDAEKADLPASVVMIVDKVQVHESEIMELAKYFAGYDGGSADKQVERSIKELMRVKVIEAGIGADKVSALRKQIDKLRADAAAAGADFGAIAKANSHCPSKDQGGSLGQFGRQSMVAPFALHAFSTPVGQVSPVFATNFGYHFVKVTGKQKGATPAEDQVTASHVLIMFDQDQSKMSQYMNRLQQGQAEIAVRNDEWRKKLPASLR
jgi:hypothetical protein